MAIQTRILTNDEAFDRWAADLVTRAVDHRNAAWTIGDLLLEGLEKFDEARVWTAAEATGMTPETLTNYKSLAKTFRPGRRRMNLGISVHETVRSLDETAQNLFLDMVEKYEITREALRERVRAYKAGDAGAANYKWKPQPKVIEVEDSHAGVSDDDDKPVFDATDAGQGIAAERETREPSETLSDAHQSLLRSLDAIERATTAENCRMLPMARINTARLRSAAAVLLRIADEADAIQAGKLTRRNPDSEATRSQGRATAAPTAPSAGTGGDKDRQPNSKSASALDEHVLSASAESASDEISAPNSNPEMDRDGRTSAQPINAVPAESARKAIPVAPEDGSVSHAGAGEIPATHSIPACSSLPEPGGDGVASSLASSPNNSDDFDPVRDMPAHLRDRPWAGRGVE